MYVRNAILEGKAHVRSQIAQEKTLYHRRANTQTPVIIRGIQETRATFLLLASQKLTLSITTMSLKNQR